MILKVFAVYDSKAEAYFPPFYESTHATGIRQFSNKVGTPNHPWAQHPEDFSLFCVGSFDDQNGVITPCSPHVTLGKAIEYVKQPN